MDDGKELSRVIAAHAIMSRMMGEIKAIALIEGF